MAVDISRPDVRIQSITFAVTGASSADIAEGFTDLPACKAKVIAAMRHEVPVEYVLVADGETTLDPEPIEPPAEDEEDEEQAEAEVAESSEEG